MSNTFEVNQQASIAVLGMRISEALNNLEDNDIDSVRDLLLDAHSSIFPNASRTATPEENAKICAAEPKGTPAPPADPKRLLETASYLLGRSRKLSNAVFTCAGLLCDHEDLDSCQIEGLATLLEGAAVDYINELGEHSVDVNAIETMLAA